MSIDELAKYDHYEWNLITFTRWLSGLETTFLDGIPTDSEWSDFNSIVQVLSGALTVEPGEDEHSYMFYPSFGASAIVKVAAHASDRHMMTYHEVTEHGAVSSIMRPVRLRFHSPSDMPKLAFFWIDCSKVDRDMLAQEGDSHLVSQVEGPVLIMCKSNPINLYGMPNIELDNGFHARLGEEEFTRFVDMLAVRLRERS